MGRLAPLLLDQRLDADGEVGAGDAVLALVEGDVGRRHLEFARRELLALLDDLFGAGLQRRAVTDQRARAEGAGAEKLGRRHVVDAHLDPVVGKTQNVGDQRRENGLVPLPRRTGVGIHRELAVGADADLDLLLAHAARRFEEQRKPDAAQLAVPLRGLAARVEAFPVRGLQRGVEKTRRIGAVIGRAGQRLQREPSFFRRLRRRSATGSMPVTSAASSTSRSQR